MSTSAERKLAGELGHGRRGARPMILQVSLAVTLVSCGVVFGLLVSPAIEPVIKACL